LIKYRIWFYKKKKKKKNQLLDKDGGRAIEETINRIMKENREGIC